MSKALLLSVCCVAVVGAVYCIALSPNKTPHHTARATFSQKHTNTVASTIQPHMSLQPAVPERIYIAKLGVDAPVRAVGRDAANTMQEPASAMEAAWYQYGYMPGVLGNAVIAGHSLYRSKPALFSNLKTLIKGDAIEIVSQNHTKLTFIVTDSRPYDASASTDELFGPSKMALLRLVTCHGSWDRAAQQYTERLVVTAAFTKEESLN